MLGWLAATLVPTAMGVVSSVRVVPRLELSARLALGAALGVAYWRWSPWLASRALGIERGAYAALLLAAVVLAIGLASRTTRSRLAEELRAAIAALRSERRIQARLGVFTLFAALVALLSYRYYLQERPDGYFSQGVIHDLAAHLMYVNDFRWCLDFMPLEHPNLPGTPFGYHFLSDVATAATMALGSSVNGALRGAALKAITCSFVLAFHLFRRTLGSDARAWTALALAFLCGGFGFVHMGRALAPGAPPWLDATYDFEKKLQYCELLVNILLPARAAQSGFPMVLAALFLLDRGCDREEGTWDEVAVGSALVGLLPLVHAHSALCAGVIALGWMLLRRPPARRALSGLAIAVALGAPQAWWYVRQRGHHDTGSHLELFWMAKDLELSPLALWAWNLGPFLALAAAGWFAASPAQRRLVAPFLVLFVIGNVAVFTPIPFDNMKIFIYFQVGASILATEALAWAWRRGRAGAAAATVLLVLATLSGAHAVFVMCVRPLVLIVPRRYITTGEAVRAATEPDDILLTGSFALHPVTMLSGRRVALGATQCLREDGHDVTDEAAKVKVIYNGGWQADEFLLAFQVDWVVVGELERREFPDLDEQYFERQAIETVQGEDVTLYRIK